MDFSVSLCIIRNCMDNLELTINIFVIPVLSQGSNYYNVEGTNLYMLSNVHNKLQLSPHSSVREF